MRTSVYIPGPARIMTFFVMLLTALAFLPPAPVAARVIKVVPLDDTQNEFGAGTRILTSVIPTVASDIPGAGDEPASGANPVGAQGGLSMAAIRALRWSNQPASNIGLPPLSQVAAAVLGKNIWIIGGTADAINYSKSVYRGVVTNTPPGTTGAGNIAWSTQTVWDLPGICYQTCPPSPLFAERTAASAAALSTGGDAGYLYVVGGAVASGSTFSSNSVLVGDVNASGNLEWRASQPYRLPVGLEGAGVFVHTTTAGKRFLYIIGGYSDPFGIAPPAIRNTVYYAEIDALGNLALGANNNSWLSTTLPANLATVYNTAVTSGVFADVNGVSRDIFFVYGGRPTQNTSSATVLKGEINPDTGAITWLDSSFNGPAAMPDSLNRHGAVSYDGNVYLIGGFIGANPGSMHRNGYSSYIDASTLTLFEDLNTSANFFKDEPPSTRGALPSSAAPGRAEAGVVLVPTTNPAFAYAYLIGGTDGGQAQDEVFRATIGPEGQDVLYPSTAYYYSRPYSMLDLIGENQATVRKITWLTDIEAAQGGDIKLEYRIYTPAGGSCANVSGNWTPVDGTADSRFSNLNLGADAYAINTQAYDENELLPPGNCFQYRATFTSGSTKSPVLLRLGMEVIVPGNPDLIWPANALTPTLDSNNFAKGIEVRLRNENTSDGAPTQPATLCHATRPDCGSGGVPFDDGSFFIDVFIFPPDVAPIVPTLPLLASGGDTLANAALGQYHRACLQVPKSVMLEDVTYLIGETTRWSDVQAVTLSNCESAITNQNVASAKPLFQFFDKGPGTYKVILVADSDDDLKGLVVETDAEDGDHISERNNVSSVFDVIIGGSTLIPMYLPITLR